MVTGSSGAPFDMPETGGASNRTRSGCSNWDPAPDQDDSVLGGNRRGQRVEQRGLPVPVPPEIRRYGRTPPDCRGQRVARPVVRKVPQSTSSLQGKTS